MSAEMYSLYDILKDYYGIDLNSDLWIEERDRLERAGMLRDEVFFTSEECEDVYDDILEGIGKDFGSCVYDSFMDWYNEQDWSERDLDPEEDCLDCGSYVRSNFDFNYPDSVLVYCYDSILKMFDIDTVDVHIYSLEEYKPFGKNIGDITVDSDWVSLYDIDSEYTLYDIFIKGTNRYDYSKDWGFSFSEGSDYRDAFGGLE